MRAHIYWFIHRNTQQPLLPHLVLPTTSTTPSHKGVISHYQPILVSALWYRKDNTAVVVEEVRPTASSWRW